MRMIVERMSWSLRVDYTFGSVLTVVQWVDNVLTRMQKKIPKAMSKSGYIRFEIPNKHPAPDPINAVDDITKAAQVDSAKDPKRSALIPATSPTLSPTLSAIVAGFLGLSSGNPV